MFDQTNTYQGGIVLSDSPSKVDFDAGHGEHEANLHEAEMTAADSNLGQAVHQADHGNLAQQGQHIPSEHHQVGNANTEANGHQSTEGVSTNTPSTLLMAAEAEASRIVEEARENAIATREEILAQAQREAQEIQASALNEIALNFGSDLWTARHSLAQIVSGALEHMIGEMGEAEATLKAVEHAIRQHCVDKQVTIRAEQNTANRIKLALLSRQKDFNVAMLKVENDDRLEKGRCIICAEEHAFEVSVRGQLNVINSVGVEAVLSAPEGV